MVKMTTYIVQACYGGSSLCQPHQNPSFPSSVEAAVVAFGKLLAIIFVTSLTGSTCKRLRTMIELCTDKRVLLDKQLYILHDFRFIYRKLQQHGIAILVHVLSKFPLNSNTVNSWFLVSQKDLSGDVSDVHAINLNNAGRTDKLYSPQNGVAFPNGLADNGQKLFFHGTSHEGALNIMKKGIDLTGKATKKGDFSNGRSFYLTDEFNTALKWADSRYNRHSQAAVLVFKLDTNRLGEYERMDLCGNDAIVRGEWESVIRKCRLNGKGLERKKLRGIDYIEGPMAIVSGETVRPIRHSYQLCILSDEMAEAFDECLHSVVFHSSST